MAKLFLIARHLLGVFVFVFGLNKFIGFMEFPPYDGFAAQYMTVVSGSYILKSMGVIYILSAFLLVTGRAVGLATVLLAPIAYNAFMFHLTLDPANIAGAIVFVALIAVVAAGNKDKYVGLLRQQAMQCRPLGLKQINTQQGHSTSSCSTMIP